MFVRSRVAGSRGAWRRGDYVELDIGMNGAFGQGLHSWDRRLRIAKTFMYEYADEEQPGGGSLRRWYDYLVLHRAYDRGRFVGWRRARGCWTKFGQSGGHTRYE